jgi:spore germination cell wall hydrolase CwlJ-like protein
MNLIEAAFWITLTVYYEARGESREGQKAVAKVILNRALKNKWPIRNVVLARKQFSVYNSGLDSPTLIIKEIPTLVKIHDVVQEAITEWGKGDRLHGSTHYYAAQGMADGKPPYWIQGMQFITEIGHHKFYREG